MCMFKAFVFLYLTVFLSFSLNSQSKIVYVNEVNKIISQSEFNSKINSPIYQGLKFPLNDSIIIKKIRFKYFFGSLNSKKKKQLFQLLSKRHNVDTSKIMVLHYDDTLKLKSSFPKRNRTVFYDSLGREVNVDKISGGYNFRQMTNVVKHLHQTNYRRFLSEHKKCLRRYSKNKETVILHFFNFNEGHPTEYKGLVWSKDYGSVLKTMFFDAYQSYQSILLYPNGDYYLGYDSDLINKNLLDFKNMTKYKNDFITELNSFKIHAIKLN